MQDPGRKIVKRFGPFYHEFKISKRIVSKVRGTKTLNQELYVIERRTRILNLVPLWWSTFYSKYAFCVMDFKRGGGYECILNATDALRSILEDDVYTTTKIKKVEVGPEDYI